ncbi:hypothetical protein LCGC14_0567920 [marine sediment metagenome]|uniref:Uncharacterized protein n=1 Tax=marine sediment metagenome TaxID=412755 RepID=A0A0F9S3Q5_9ZZZZ
MSDEEIDRAAELVELLKQRHLGFGTVLICLSGRRFVCSFKDLQKAVREIREDSATAWL